MAVYEKEVEKWGCFEVVCEGNSEGNPFVDRWITGQFIGKNESVMVDGFCDGDVVSIRCDLCRHLKEIIRSELKEIMVVVCRKEHLK